MYDEYISTSNPIETLKKAITERPKSYMKFEDEKKWFQENGWGYLPEISKYPRCDLIESSNYEVILQDLMKKFPDSIETSVSHHWLVSSCEQIAVDTSNEKLMEYIVEIYKKLASYPIMNEDDYYEKCSELKEEAMDDWIIPEIIDHMTDFVYTEEWIKKNMNEDIDVKQIFKDENTFDKLDLNDHLSFYPEVIKIIKENIDEGEDIFLDSDGSTYYADTSKCAKKMIKIDEMNDILTEYMKKKYQEDTKENKNSM